MLYLSAVCSLYLNLFLFKKLGYLLEFCPCVRCRSASEILLHGVVENLLIFSQN